MMTRPNTYNPGRSATDHRAASVGTQSQFLFTQVLMIIVTIVTGFCIATSKWRQAVADSESPFGSNSELFPSEFIVPANVGDFVLGTDWFEFVKNLFAIVIIITLLHLLRPVLPFGRNRH